MLHSWILLMNIPRWILQLSHSIIVLQVGIMCLLIHHHIHVGWLARIIFSPTTADFIKSQVSTPISLNGQSTSWRAIGQQRIRLVSSLLYWPHAVWWCMKYNGTAESWPFWKIISTQIYPTKSPKNKWKWFRQLLSELSSYVVLPEELMKPYTTPPTHPPHHTQ
jgi:hypothetical protein